MTITKNSIIACTSAFALAGALALTGCGASGYTGGVAATVNGTDIQEDTITAYVENFRTSSGYTSESDWGNWLSSSGMTPSEVRESVIDYYVDQELEKQQAEKYGVTVDESQIDEQVAKVKAYYSSDDDWNSALSSAGFTEQSYRDSLYMSILESELQDKVISDADAAVSDDDVLSMVQSYASSYDGMKRSSHILFASGDEAKAQEVLDQINAGTLDFATAAQTYSIDTGSAADGGDVGWDALNSFVTEYTDALSGLSKDQVSGLVTSSYGIHIIKCTDVFTAPSEITDLSQVPTALTDMIRSYLLSSAKSTQYSTWLQNIRSEADVSISDMPSGVAYNVDMSKYESSSSSSDTTTSSSSSN